MCVYVDMYNLKQLKTNHIITVLPILYYIYVCNSKRNLQNSVLLIP